MARALCAGSAPNLRVDPELEDYFFPEKGGNYDTALWMCMQCPVRVECEQYKDKINAKHGMWGARIATKEDDDDDDPTA